LQLCSIALLVILVSATQKLDTHDDFIGFLSEAKRRPAIVYFYTEKCGPCQTIAPVFDEVAAAYGGRVFFAKVDARENEDTPDAQHVVSLPTVQFYLGDEMVHQTTKDVQEFRDWTEHLVDMAGSAGGVVGALKDDRADATKQQARAVSTMFPEDRVPSLQTCGGHHLKTRSVKVATGQATRHAQAAGTPEFNGKGLSDCAACDAHLIKAEPCAVIGDGNAAVEDALLLSHTCSSVAILAEGSELQASPALKKRLRRALGITVHLNHEVVGSVGRRRRMGGQLKWSLAHLEVRHPPSQSESSPFPTSWAFARA